jgi:BMFP domain-containing protein YqiC
MNVEPVVGWLVAVVSAIGNVVQLFKGLKRSDAEIDRLKQETEQLWQEMQFKALEKAHELQDAIREQAQEWLDRMRTERDEFAAQNRLLLSRVDTLENTVEELAYQLAIERKARERERKAWQKERQELLTKIACLEDKLKEYKRQLGVVQDATSTQPL